MKLLVTLLLQSLDLSLPLSFSNRVKLILMESSSTNNFMDSYKFVYKYTYSVVKTGYPNQFKIGLEPFHLVMI